MSARCQRKRNIMNEQNKQPFLLRIFTFFLSHKILAVLCAVLLLFNLGLVGVIVHDANEKAHIREIEQYVDAACEEFGFSKAIVLAVIKTESNFDAKAESSANARGLMQITEVALSDINKFLSEEYTFRQMFDPATNIRCGVCYLSRLYEKYKNYDTAFAAYNAGQGNVDKWLKDSRYSKDQKTLYKIPFGETTNYVKKVNRYRKEYQKRFE